MRKLSLVGIQWGYPKRGKKSGFSRNQKCPHWIFKLSGINDISF